MFMKRACNLGLFHGVNLPNSGPCISHLCYADDILFLGEWSEHNLMALIRLFRWLSLITGLKINCSKSTIYGVGVSDAEVSSFAKMANCGYGSFPFIHLRIPIGVNMKREKFWKPMLDKISAKLSKWKARHLSFAGRMTLAKSVLGRIPSYYLSIFAAPKGIIQKMDKIRRDFVWGISDSGRKMRWIRWEYMMKAKKLGGMGLGGIRNFNLAMLSKWWWRFLSNPNELWVLVVGAIHKGKAISIPPDIPVKKSIPGLWKDIALVEYAMHKEGIYLKDKLERIGNIWIWKSDDYGGYSVKQVRFDLDKANEDPVLNRPIFSWNCWAPPKANFLLWRSLIGRIASKDGLIRRGLSFIDGSCSRCGLGLEDQDHIFSGCLWARSIWWNILRWLRISFPVEIVKISDMLDFINNQPGGVKWKRVVYTVVLATVWRIWKARNEMTFEARFIPVTVSVNLIKEDAYLC
ncbi:putative reverse transcriptase zinc-binding domain-containing protein [Helianthus anomalus]